MCGIGAVFSLSGKSVKQSDLNTMMGLLYHRGPDASGSILLNNKTIGLSHVRLSIMDIEHGAQPMRDHSAEVYITYAGEIYDCDRLRKDLEGLGYRFKTHSDTEVIIKLYLAYGTDMFAHMNGEFSFVLWDDRRKLMLASRDRFGIKPLYYYQHSDEIVFASEAKALIGLGRVSHAPSPEYLLSSFMGAFVGQESFYKDIETLKPGHYLLIQGDQVKEVEYWKPDYQNKTNLSFNEAADELRSLTNKAVERRLVSDSPIGCFLSGGIDSSVVATLASKFKRDIPSFSIGFTGQSFDESTVAEQTANALGIPFSCYQASKNSLTGSLTDTLRHIELPIASPQPIGMTLLSKHVRDYGVKSCLTGEGADELLAGYAYFKLDQMRERHRQGELDKASFNRLYKRFEQLEKNNKVLLWFPSKEWRRHTYRDRYDSSYNVRYNQVSGFRERLFSDELKASQAGVNQTIETLYSSLYDQNMNGIDFNRSLSFKQLSHYIFPMQGDRVQMSHSIEGRVPFLDNDVVAFAQSLPPEYLIELHSLQEKRLLHEAFKHDVPKHMIKRHKQAYHSGFTWSDFAQHSSGREMWEHYLSRSNLKKTGLFNPSFVRLIKALNRLAPNHSTLKCQTDLLLGNIFTSLALQDVMSKASLTEHLNHSIARRELSISS